MLRPIAPIVALALLAACATAAPEPEEIVETGATETPAEQIERIAMERLGQELEGTLPEGLQVNVIEIEELEAGLFYKVELVTAKGRRREQDYVLYGQCQPTDIPHCADQVVSAARMLKE